MVVGPALVPWVRIGSRRAAYSSSKVAGQGSASHRISSGGSTLHVLYVLFSQPVSGRAPPQGYPSIIARLAGL